MSETVRWGVLGTANIARVSFLPGLRRAGGKASAVGGRDLARAEAFARENEVERAVAGYEAVLEDPTIEAVYIPLPNALHVEWTKKALAAGKAVLTEKPLATSQAETSEILTFARAVDGLLWEAFVFPFQPQFRRLKEILAVGEIGDVLEIRSSFHFQTRDRANIRYSPELAGGALNDVGCYAVHLAQALFEDDPEDGRALASWAPEGVESEAWGALRYPGGRSLVFSCGMDRAYDTSTVLVGTRGSIRLSNPYHPGAADTLEVRVGEGVRVERPTGDEPSFTAAIRHIQEVVQGRAAPVQTATETAWSTAQAMELLRRSMGPCPE